ncbi:MAG: Holliday junction resolvase RuvX [Bacteroidales bacterium]|nr:Holliday junction resolvase RuvX [Bacteroidales bacterium]
MGRILAIDYGQKRTGIAVTDELQIIATSLGTVATKDIWNFLTEYNQKEKLDTIVVGEPRDMQNRPSDSSRFVEPFVNKLRKTFPNLKIERFDERFTSKMAQQAMIDGGLKKQKRQDKALVDSISATLILQSYLESLNFLRK